MRAKLILSWSGGKDSAMALYELKRAAHWDVVALLTTITEDYDRISMHGVRRTLLEQQAAALELPLVPVLISKRSSNEEYETKMRRALEEQKRAGVVAVAFGDIFLEDLRHYREGKLAETGLTPVFPIWLKPSKELAAAFIDLGFEAITTCVDSQKLDRRFVGRSYDRQFLSELPEGIDPCGENGEFHSFAHNGPIFRERVPFRRGEVVLRDERFFFCDLLPPEKLDV